MPLTSERQHGFYLYVHIPFCDVRCPYCHFYCFVNRDPMLPRRYARALVDELRMYTEQDPAFAGPIRSVYFGGGTPSALPPDAREEICRWMRDDLADRLTPDAEITLEVNPESAWPESLREWVAAGVNRVSLGVQSMDGDTLKFLGRLNTPASNRRAIQLACRLVENVSIDLILATPNASWTSTLRSLEAVCSQPITHVSAYLLEIHSSTRFGRDVASGRWQPTPDDDQAELYLRAVDWLSGRGYAPYEVSNFAMAGFEAVHNSAYWRREPYLGLGASAHSYLEPRRWWNVSAARDYCEKIESRATAMAEDEVLTAQQRWDEDLLLRLRTRQGFRRGELAGHDALWRAWEESGLAEASHGRYRLSPRGWLVLDQIAERLSRTGTSSVPGGS